MKIKNIILFVIGILITTMIKLEAGELIQKNPLEVSLEDTQIVENLLSKDKSGKWWSAVSDIKEVNLIELFGFDVESPKYRLYSGFIQGIPARGHVAISRNRSSQFVIKDQTTFNDFISSLNLSLKGNKEFIQITKVFLKIAFINLTEPEILWKLPRSTEKEEIKGIEKWFSTHPKYSFYSPKTGKIKGGYYVEYYTWKRSFGILESHYFELKENGEIITHRREELDTQVGNYIII